MKRIVVAICSLIFLVGCSNGKTELDRALELRNRVSSANICSFQASVSAEYDERIYTFGLSCKDQCDGNLYFEVLRPDTIAGITGTIAQSSGKLTFDNEVLAFEMMIDNRLSPVSAPWLFLHLLKSGYIAACGMDGEGSLIQIEDTYANEKIMIDLYTDQNNNPIRADIVWNGQRNLSIVVSEFTTM